MELPSSTDKRYGVIKWFLITTLFFPAALWATQFTNSNKKATDDSALHSNTPDITQITSDSIRGIDVSHYQGNINWKNVANSGIVFAYAKATGGETFIDPTFKTNWHNLRTSEIYRGAYHFFFADDDPKKQANIFIKTVGTLKPHDLPPMLDVEISDHTDKNDIQQRVLIWLKEVEKKMKVIPIIYTDNGFGDTVFTNPDFARYPLWIAEYSNTVSTLPPAWANRQWTFWQYSQTGVVNGVSGNVDTDVFNGNMQDFTAFLQRSHKK